MAFRLKRQDKWTLSPRGNLSSVRSKPATEKIQQLVLFVTRTTSILNRDSIQGVPEVSIPPKKYIFLHSSRVFLYKSFSKFKNKRVHMYNFITLSFFFVGYNFILIRTPSSTDCQIRPCTRHNPVSGLWKTEYGGCSHTLRFLRFCSGTVVETNIDYSSGLL